MSQGVIYNRLSKLLIGLLAAGLMTLLGLIGKALWDYKAYIYQQNLQLTNAPLVPKDRIEEYMINPIAYRYNSEGRLRQQLSAERINYHPRQMTTLLVEPRFIIPQADGGYYALSSQLGEGYQGHIGESLNKLTIKDEVVIHQLPDLGEQPSWTLKTDYIDLYPSTEIGETKAPVLLTGPGTQIQATGLRADLATGQLTLLEQVTTKYDTETWELSKTKPHREGS